MRISVHGFISITVLLCITSAMAGQTRHVAPGEVPEGITAEDWAIVQEAYLKASNTDMGDWFSCSVAAFGDTIVIGAEREDSIAVGVDGNQGSIQTLILPIPERPMSLSAMAQRGVSKRISRHRIPTGGTDLDAP